MEPCYDYTTMSGTDREIRHLSMLVEEVISQNKAVLEIVGDMQENMKCLAKSKDLEEVKTDVKTTVTAVTDTNKQVNNHEKRITKLEKNSLAFQP